MAKFKTTPFLLILLIAGCKIAPNAPPPIPLSPKELVVERAGALRLKEVAAASGVVYRWSVSGPRPLDILQTIGRGCAFLDYDNDGNLDILLVGEPPALFRGDGKGNFTDVSARTGMAALRGHFLGCAVGDVDNDGFPDIYLSGYREGRLFHNEQGKRFTDASRQWRIAPQPWGTSCGFADLDGDGYLDLVVANYVKFDSAKDKRLCADASYPTAFACGPTSYPSLFPVVYRNLAGKRFQDVTDRWTLRSNGKSLGVAFADFEDSGNVSIALANDETPNDLFVRQNRKTFQNVAALRGVARVNGNAFAGMGLDWGDYDNDGRLDLFVTAYANEVKPLFRNQGDGNFASVSYDCGLFALTAPSLTFGCKFADFDNDGWLDLILANGHVQSNQEAYPGLNPGTYRQRIQMLRNSAGHFYDVSAASGTGATVPIVGRGLAIGDYDNDGKIDALIVDNEGSPLLLHNETLSRHHFIGLRLVDKAGRDAYNALVTIKSDGKSYLRLCTPCGSYLSSSDARVLIGIGDAPALDSVTIRWPNGDKQTLTNVPIDCYSTIQQFPTSEDAPGAPGWRPQNQVVSAAFSRGIKSSGGAKSVRPIGRRSKALGIFFTPRDAGRSCRTFP